jgi:phosphoribosylamine--glycine ligase
VTERIRGIVMDTVVAPTLAGMRARGTPFVGVLFVGLMIDRGEPRVLEFNVRFGDPETSVLVPTFAGDWFETLRAAADGELSSLANRELHQARGAAMGVVLAAEGYPGKVTTGDVITGLNTAFPTGGHVLHAGTRNSGDGAVLRGTFAGLDPNGALRLSLENGTTQTIHAGDVSLIAEGNT